MCGIYVHVAVCKWKGILAAQPSPALLRAGEGWFAWDDDDYDTFIKVSKL